MLGTQRQIGQSQANWPKFCLKCLQTVNKVPWTLVLPLMDDSPPTALTHLTKSIARAPSSPPAQAALNLHSNWRYSFPKWQLALTPCQAPSWMVEMQRWASSRRRLPSQPWSAETYLGGGEDGELENGEPLAHQLARGAHETAGSCSSRYSPAVLGTWQLLIQKQEVFLILWHLCPI